MNMSCYLQALRHHSASATIHENGSRDSNERLEYLGDAVLNIVVAELLFNKFPFKSEGFLTEMRSKIVSRESLNDLALKIGLNQIVSYDRKAIGSNRKNSIFGNALEAFIGAIFLDAGFYKAKRFITNKLLSHIDVDKLQFTETNFKGKLIEWAQRNNKILEFENQEEIIQKQKIYKVRVLLDRVLMGGAENSSKKKAEQMASQKAYEAVTSEPIA
jgi:ribonuclease III